MPPALCEGRARQIHVFLSSVSLADVVEKRVLGRAQPCTAPEPDATGREAANREAA